MKTYRVYVKESGNSITWRSFREWAKSASHAIERLRYALQHFESLDTSSMVAVATADQLDFTHKRVDDSDKTTLAKQFRGSSRRRTTREPKEVYRGEFVTITVY